MKTRNKTLLLILLVIIALILVYIFVAPKSATAPVLGTPKTTQKDEYKVIKEFGLKYKITPENSFINYKMDTSGPVLQFYSSESTDCELSYIISSVTDREPDEIIKDGDSIRKIGYYYYRYINSDHRDGPCINSKTGKNYSKSEYEIVIKQNKITKSIFDSIILSEKVEGNTDDLISFSIKPGQEVTGKMKVTGIIKGGYFFEGNLPMIILDANKNITLYGPGHATATTDWMTAGPVSFETEFDFSTMPKGKAYIKIIQDDPSGGESGIPVQSVIIPIIVK